MPLFEYRCRECEEHFEKLVGMTASRESETCPRCGSADVARQYSAFATAARTGPGGQVSCSADSGFG